MLTQSEQHEYNDLLAIRKLLLLDQVSFSQQIVSEFGWIGFRLRELTTKLLKELR